MGFDCYCVMGGLNFDICYCDLFFLLIGEGFGVNVLCGLNWCVSLLVGYDFGCCLVDDFGYLNGFDNINVVFVMKFVVDYVVLKDFLFVLCVDVWCSIGGLNGWIGDFFVYMLMLGSNEYFFWFVGLIVMFVDFCYMNSWFGVNLGVVVCLGLLIYLLGVGIKLVGFGVMMVWFVNKYWFVMMDGVIE